MHPADSSHREFQRWAAENAAQVSALARLTIQQTHRIAGEPIPVAQALDLSTRALLRRVFDAVRDRFERGDPLQNPLGYLRTVLRHEAMSMVTGESSAARARARRRHPHRQELESAAFLAAPIAGPETDPLGAAFDARVDLSRIARAAGLTEREEVSLRWIAGTYEHEPSGAERDSLQRAWRRRALPKIFTAAGWAPADAVLVSRHVQWVRPRERELEEAMHLRSQVGSPEQAASAQAKVTGARQALSAAWAELAASVQLDQDECRRRLRAVSASLRTFLRGDA